MFIRKRHAARALGMIACLFAAAPACTSPTGPAPTVSKAVPSSDRPSNAQTCKAPMVKRAEDGRVLRGVTPALQRLGALRASMLNRTSVMIEYADGTVGEISMVAAVGAAHAKMVSTVGGTTVEVDDYGVVARGGRVSIHDNLFRGQPLTEPQAAHLDDHERAAANQLIAFFTFPQTVNAAGSSRMEARPLRPQANVVDCVNDGLEELIDDINPLGIGALCEIAVDGCEAALAATGLAPESGVPEVGDIVACVAAGACTGVDITDMISMVSDCIGC